MSSPKLILRNAKLRRVPGLRWPARSTTTVVFASIPLSPPPIESPPPPRDTAPASESFGGQTCTSMAFDASGQDVRYSGVHNAGASPIGTPVSTTGSPRDVTRSVNSSAVAGQGMRRTTPPSRGRSGTGAGHSIWASERNWGGGGSGVPSIAYFSALSANAADLLEPARWFTGVAAAGRGNLHSLHPSSSSRGRLPADEGFTGNITASGLSDDSSLGIDTTRLERSNSPQLSRRSFQCLANGAATTRASAAVALASSSSPSPVQDSPIPPIKVSTMRSRAHT
mmetsp:Transcript_5519/g.24800  ORF Transcript_5519/g.24800 Transcript_5519/m.24800 type:complete len:282 (+) Transcript_5519:2380-3225(+)